MQQNSYAGPESLLRELERVAQVGTWSWEFDGRPSWSRGLYRLLEVDPATPTEALGTTFFERVHPDERASLRAAQERLRETGRLEPTELRLVLPSGKLRWVRAHGTVLRDERGQPVASFGAFVDISEQKALEDTLRRTAAFEALGSLSAGLAHDLRNALTVISACLARVDARSPTQADSLTSARRAVAHSTALLQQLLTLASNQKAPVATLDARALLEGLLRLLRAALPAGITVRSELGDEPAWVRIAPSHLEAALMNLALNARDAMPGGGSLTLRLGRVDARTTLPGEVPPGPCFRLDVADSGTGIPAELLARVFEPYFSTKPKTRGTGLGLASVYATAKQHGGTVTVSSHPGSGSCFSLWLPEAEAPVAVQPPVTPRPEPRRRTLLLVDDMDPVRRSTALLLASEGYRVLEAESAQVALKKLRSHDEVELVLADVLMPGTSGITFARQARDEGFAQPFVFLTGFSEAVDEQSPEDLGQVLLKPYTLDALKSAISQALDAERR